MNRKWLCKELCLAMINILGIAGLSAQSRPNEPVQAAAPTKDISGSMERCDEWPHGSHGDHLQPEGHKRKDQRHSCDLWRGLHQGQRVARRVAASIAADFESPKNAVNP